MDLKTVTLDDKYELESGRVFLNGTQALVRLTLMQRQRDRAAGLNTAGLVTGYRGSPLGGVDREFTRARRALKAHDVLFTPGVNEDLAATAIWGSQQVNMFDGATVDGVFGMWYGKGPGVDRSGDVFRHGNYAGSSRHGGVLVLAGDDPACKSSTVPSQSEYAFMDAQIPTLNPANIQDILDFGLFGWAMSRYSGLWVGMKTITENMDSSASVHVDPARNAVVLPTDFEMPPDGLNIRDPDPPLVQERRLQQYKMYAALAFARANRIDRVVVDSPEPRLGIVTTGKSYLDVMQALDDLGIDQKHAAEIGLRVYKVGMPWPLERNGVRAFAEGLEEILVIEEKRAVIENQLKEQLYNWREDVRPRVVGKFDENGAWILPSAGELTPARVARVIAQRIDGFYTSTRIKHRLEFLEEKERSLETQAAKITRIPYFCSGCPHNTSTVVPEGSRAVAGIGCHYMAVWMNRKTSTFTHMGGEGANWIGQAPFTETKHIFANLGDGTYHHSGILAIRAAVAAGVNITYKILFNDAVAMTGGQPLDGHLTVPAIARQVDGEGVGRIAVVSDEPGKYPIGAHFPHGTTFHHRDDLDAVQRELRDWQGVSVLIYDQTCAAEKRRRRKRGQYPDPPKRVFINEAVCEGCGDCGVQSNCVSIAPAETPFGRKRAIDQSSCNKDFSCLRGFCPSFVTVHGGTIRKKGGDQAAGVGEADFPALPDPDLPALDAPYRVVVTGIGGTGVVTVGAILGMAAHLEGKGTSVLDMIGLAQKNGAVLTHVQFAAAPEDIQAVRIAAGGANLLLGCDVVTAGGAEALSKMRAGHSAAVVNTHETMTASFTQNPDMAFPEAELEAAIARATGGSLENGAADFIDAARLATALMGDSIASNMFMVGFAFQKGLLPLSAAALEQAIDLNDVSVDFNRRAFLWGRRAAHDRARVIGIAGLRPRTAEADAGAGAAFADLDALVAHRATHLGAYQNAALADRFRALVDRARTAERQKAPGMSGLAEAVAWSYHKLLAYKDEYEVARLYADPAFMDALRDQFDGDFKLSYHLAPPLISPRDPNTGLLRKREFGAWMRPLFGLLAEFRFLRGTALDPFGHTAERRMERGLIAGYESVVDELLAGLTADNHGLATEIAALPRTMRGFGHVKQRNVAAARAREAELMESFRSPQPRMTAAE
ncbi:MAG: indolepyruvate ferredoxin oxidoreductase family protein [Hyphomicrobiales bacterium]|nr:indolepyruvate ferredoxin oxidoreductase family protein [Hyphomicrobiales bacterium]